jgi:hypothetical protein
VAAPTHYDVLGVAASATHEEIRRAYRARARTEHPDAAGGTGSPDDGAGVRMAAVNQAWFVLSDPGRRAIYDAHLRDRAGVGSSAGGGPHRPAAPAPRPAADDAPGAFVGRRRFPIWPFVILFVLGAIFIVTAGALTVEPRPSGPDNLLVNGSCVTIEANGDAKEVDCAGPTDGVVVTIVGFDQHCPSETRAHRDRQGRGWACVDPD